MLLWLIFNREKYFFEFLQEPLSGNYVPLLTNPTPYEVMITAQFDRPKSHIEGCRIEGAI